jgi:hypothetical protein
MFSCIHGAAPVMVVLLSVVGCPSPPTCSSSLLSLCLSARVAVWLAQIAARLASGSLVVVVWARATWVDVGQVEQQE